MKEFGQMTEQEFHRERRKADLALFSRWAIFAQRTRYMRFERMDGIQEPKWSVFENYKFLPHHLDLLENAEHPNYIVWSVSESQLETDPTY